jgi:cytochrome c oxidase assembly protein subunit 15
VPDVPAHERAWLIGLTALIYAQILVGATMRHLGAGLAIPDFPLAFGGLLPPAWPLPVAIHFAHRVGALIVTLLVAATFGHILYHHRARRDLVRAAWLLVAAVATQVTLGALIILTRRQPVVNTLHVATGAVVLGTSLVITLRSYRVRSDAGS